MSTTPTPTPRTDAADIKIVATTKYGVDEKHFVSSNFARQLERELAEAKETAERYRLCTLKQDAELAEVHKHLVDANRGAQTNASINQSFTTIIVELRAENERLREVLQPFAKVLGGNWSNQPDHLQMTFGFGGDKRFDLRLGHFRAAVKALTKEERGRVNDKDQATAPIV